MARLDWRNAVVWLPSQTLGLGDAVGLTRGDLAAAVWALMPDGRLLAGAPAIMAAADALLPGGLGLFSAILQVPGARAAADRTYAWVASHRQRLPGTAACRADGTGVTRGCPVAAAAGDSDDAALAPQSTVTAAEIERRVSGRHGRIDVSGDGA
jgi:hypothetical protein